MKNNQEHVLTVSGFHVPKTDGLVKLSDVHEKEIYQRWVRRPARDMLDKYGDKFYLSPMVTTKFAQFVVSGTADFEFFDSLLDVFSETLGNHEITDILKRALTFNTPVTNLHVEFIRNICLACTTLEHRDVYRHAVSISALNPAILTNITPAAGAVVRQRMEYTGLENIAGMSNEDFVHAIMCVEDPYGGNNGAGVLLGVLYGIYGMSS